MDRSGNVTSIFAFGIIAVTTLAGGAVDLSMLQAHKSRLQAAADAAALAAASPAGKKDPHAAAAAVFDAHRRADRSGPSAAHKLSKNGEVYRVDASASPELYLLGAFGMAPREVHVFAEAVAATAGGIELAIAYDATSSMSFGSSWSDARDALGAALQSLQSKARPGEFRVSFAPFNDRVNIGVDRAAWLTGDIPAEAEDDGWTFADWEGCAEPREETIGSFDWALDDDVPADQPFEVSIAAVTGGLAEKYGNAPVCPEEPVLALTESVADVTAAADRLKKGGTGRFEVGMAWAWRLLSPDWEGLWGASGYPAPYKKAQKAALLITDGHTTAYKYEMDKAEDFGHNNASVTSLEHLVDLCARMKDEGVIVFVFQINGNPHATTYFQACASSSWHYRAVADGHELAAAFEDLGRWGDAARLVR